MTEPMTNDVKKLKEDWDGQLFGVKRSIRYHLHRRKFFGVWKVATDFLVIASGGTVVSLASSGEAKQNVWIIVSGAITAVLGTLDLVLGFSDKARDHRDLVQAFSNLEAEMEKSDVTAEKLADFKNKRLEIEVDEPPRKIVLNKYCHNELVIAEDYPADQLADIKWWQSLIKQFIDICPQRIRTFRQIEDERIAKEKAAAVAATAEKASEIRA
jgi:hypothetical protein